MTQERRKLLLCNCNRTMPLDGKTVAGALALEAVPHVASELCRRHVAAFEAAAKSGDELLVACTQEAPLFRELHDEFKATGEIRFVNIRETAGWSRESQQAAPKIAALLAIGKIFGIGRLEQTDNALFFCNREHFVDHRGHPPFVVLIGTEDIEVF